MKYVVEYNSWIIHVDADNVKQARHKAYKKFNEAYPTAYGDFMRGIDNVSEEN